MAVDTLALLIGCQPCFGSGERILQITLLQHHESDSHHPYRVRAKTVDDPVLQYELGCRLGASSLQVGKQYKATEGRNEDNIRVLSIWYAENNKPAPDVIGVECEIDSVQSVEQTKKPRASD